MTRKEMRYLIAATVYLVGLLTMGMFCLVMGGAFDHVVKR